MSIAVTELVSTVRVALELDLEMIGFGHMAALRGEVHGKGKINHHICIFLIALFITFTLFVEFIYPYLLINFIIRIKENNAHSFRALSPATTCCSFGF